MIVSCSLSLKKCIVYVCLFASRKKIICSGVVKVSNVLWYAPKEKSYLLLFLRPIPISIPLKSKSTDFRFPSFEPPRNISIWIYSLSGVLFEKKIHDFLQLKEFTFAEQNKMLHFCWIIALIMLIRFLLCSLLLISHPKYQFQREFIIKFEIM